jgi:NAD(P)-dependent dehydrogenase (short-subunit alcohol dehydrogenase family)
MSEHGSSGVVVAEAARGMGLEISRRLHLGGATVVTFDLDAGPLEDVRGGRARGCGCERRWPA